MPFDYNALNESYKQVDPEANSFKPLPTGNYEARLDEIVWDETKALIERKFVVISGPNQGKTQKDWIRFFKKDGTPNTISAERIKKEIYALDPELSLVGIPDSIPTFCEEAYGKDVKIYVSTKTNTYEGRTREQSSVYINDFLNAGVGAVGPQGDGLPF